MNRRSLTGVTLIELLVVVAIIAVLASLLLPAILQARGAARKVRCEGNLKQLAQAVQTFHHRNDCLPVYWGAMRAGGGQKFGGWLMHLLPDLDQQALFDSVPSSTTSGSTQVVTFSTATTGRMLPAIPASTDFQEGTWQEVPIGTAFVNGQQTTLTEWRLVGRVGTPGLPARPETITTVTGTIWVRTTGVNPTVPSILRASTLPFLTDTEDDGTPRSPPQSPTIPSTVTLGDMQLTNYQANAHVFTKFNSRITTGSDAGLFQIHQDWRHSLSGTSGPIGRSFANVVDGLSNTILFAEGRRQCDNLAQYRAAFFPTSNPMNEHGFGIECQWRDSSGALIPNRPTFGNTLMFQTRPTLADTNPLRVQALHGNFLMVAMCDGSTRAISSLVDRREPIGANASGRENFGTRFYEPSSRGAFVAPNANSPIGDGVWDMLMVPNDPPGNVRSNDGTIGRER